MPYLFSPLPKFDSKNFASDTRVNKQIRKSVFGKTPENFSCAFAKDTTKLSCSCLSSCLFKVQTLWECKTAPLRSERYCSLVKKERKPLQILNLAD